MWKGNTAGVRILHTQLSPWFIFYCRLGSKSKKDKFSDRKYCSIGKIHLQINQFLLKQITMQIPQILLRICGKPAATSYVLSCQQKQAAASAGLLY